MSTSERSPALSPDALTRLISHRKQFLAFLRSRVGSAEAAEDILQAAFVRSMEKGGTVRNEETIVAWFYRILRNAVIDHYRRSGSSEHAVAELAQQMKTHQEPDVSFKGDICRCVTALMESLKPEYRQALEIVDIQEQALAELSEKAQITANNAAVRVHRAREALRKQVTATCGICATHGCLDCTCRATPDQV